MVGLGPWSAGAACAAAVVANAAVVASAEASASAPPARARGTRRLFINVLLSGFSACPDRKAHAYAASHRLNDLPPSHCVYCASQDRRGTIGPGQRNCVRAADTPHRPPPWPGAVGG